MEVLSRLFCVSQVENLNFKGGNIASLATLTFRERQHFKSGRQPGSTLMGMLQMPNPDGGYEKTHMPRATAKDERRMWFERRVLGHPQPGKSSKGWFVACWVPRKRFGQRRHRCSEECEEFMTVYGPTARSVCQREVSVEQVYLRRNEEPGTSQLTLVWVSSWSRSRKDERSWIGSKMNGWTFRSRRKCSYSVLFLLSFSFKYFFSDRSLQSRWVWFECELTQLHMLKAWVPSLQY